MRAELASAEFPRSPSFGQGKGIARISGVQPTASLEQWINGAIGG
jgi:hypothetical protein